MRVQIHGSIRIQIPRSIELVIIQPIQICGTDLLASGVRRRTMTLEAVQADCHLIMANITELVLTIDLQVTACVILACMAIDTLSNAEFHRSITGDHHFISVMLEIIHVVTTDLIG
jgi:hypothetical protein